MSTTTSNLKLFKYTNEDSAEIFNFDKALNDNWDKLDTAINNKQATLVSGTNIKTINGNSILGSGNIDINGSYIAVYNSTTFNEVSAANLAKRTIFATKTENNYTYEYPLIYTDSNTFIFGGSQQEGNSIILLTLTTSGWNYVNKTILVNTATGNGSFAIGTNAQCSASNSIQIGTGTNTTDSSVQLGSYTILEGDKIPNSRISLTSAMITSALGYTPYSSANPNGYTAVTSTTVSNWGFTKNTGTVKSVNNTYPDANGNVTVSGGSSNIYVSGTTLIIS